MKKHLENKLLTENPNQINIKENDDTVGLNSNVIKIAKKILAEHKHAFEVLGND